MRQWLASGTLWVRLAIAGLALVAVVSLGVVIGGRPQALRPSPAPSASPSLTLAPSPTPAPSPSPTAAPSATPTGSPSASPRPTPTATKSPTPTPTTTARPTPTPAPSRTLPTSLRGVEWYTLPTTSKVVALTFDAGSGNQGLARILKTLADEHVPGTFFLTGQFVERYPGDVEAISAVEMHSVGNHTYDHPHMNQLSDAAVRDEIVRTEQLILHATGRQPWPLFRFPYGESSARTIADANGLGYGSIRWTVDTLGWQGTSAVGGASGGQTVQSVTRRALDAARPGEIVLMHVGAAPDGTTLDADALAGVIDGLRARGYGFVAIWDFIYS
ncbi:MAG TPA: polysaccharide deacetylase family protein [Candidatus Dormibacteraeota bacterium]